ncbi:hypothetical protein D9M69_715460 [compost metagenome]
MTQHIEGAALVKGFAQAIEQYRFGRRAMVLVQRLPGLRLGVLDPFEQVVGEQRPCPVIGLRVAFGVQPAAGSQLFADFILEGHFPMQAHASAP